MIVLRFSLRRSTFILLIISAIFLSACKANTSSTNENGLLPHLTVDMQIPTELSLGSTELFQIEVNQEGVPVDEAQVLFQFWPEKHPDQRVEVVGEYDGNGLYSADYRIKSEGIYVVRCHVSSGPLEVMPAKRFAIGEEAVRRLAAIAEQTDGVPTDEGSGTGHDHH